MAPKKASTPTKVVPKKAADVGAYLERQPGQTMKPKPIIAGYYGVRGERLRYTVHEGALRLPSASLSMIRSQLEHIQASGCKDIVAMSSYKLPHVDAVAIRPSLDPKLLAEGVVLTELSTQTHTPQPRLDPATGTMLHFQPTTRTVAENRKLPVPEKSVGIEPERIRGGGDDTEAKAPPAAPSQQPQAAVLQAPSPAVQAPAPSIPMAPAPQQATPPMAAAPTTVQAAPIQTGPPAVAAAPVPPVVRQNVGAVQQSMGLVVGPPAAPSRPAAPQTAPMAAPAAPQVPVANAATQGVRVAPTPIAPTPAHHPQHTTVLQPARPPQFTQVAAPSRPVSQVPSASAQPTRPVQRIVAPLARTGGIRNPLSAAAAVAATQQATRPASSYPQSQVPAAQQPSATSSSFAPPAPTQAPPTVSVAVRPAVAAPQQQQQRPPPQRPVGQQVVATATASVARPTQLQQLTGQTTIPARPASSTTQSVGSMPATSMQASQVAATTAMLRQQNLPSAGQVSVSSASRPVVAVSTAVPTVSASAPVARPAASVPALTTSARPPATVSSIVTAAPAPVVSSKPAASAPVPAQATSAVAPKEAPRPTPPAPKVVPLQKTPPAQYEQLAPAANDEMQVEITVDRPDWFNKDEASDLEMTLLPEWFNRSAPHRTHKSYIKTRNAILTISSKLGNRYVTKTLMRRTVPGDVGSMHRLHDFLVAYSLINADAINDSTPTHPKLRDIQFAWTQPLRDTLAEAVVEVAQPSAEGVQVDWEQVAKQVGCGVKPLDCEREFLSLTTLTTAKSASETIERSITPDAMEVDGPDSSSKDGAAAERASWLHGIARNADPQVVKAATKKALEVSSSLEQAQKSAQVALVVGEATKAARLEEEKLTRSLAELHEQRLLKLENRMAMLDDVECLLETERAALELERRDLYTARCRHWFGGGAS